MTIEDVAAAASREFQIIRGEMAMKEELQDAKAELLRAITALDCHLSAYASRLCDICANLHDSIREIEERVQMLEKDDIDDGGPSF